MTTTPLVRATLELLALKPDDTLVDLGCGDCRFLLGALDAPGSTTSSDLPPVPPIPAHISRDTWPPPDVASPAELGTLGTTVTDSDDSMMARAIAIRQESATDTTASAPQKDSRKRASQSLYASIFRSGFDTAKDGKRSAGRQSCYFRPCQCFGVTGTDAVEVARKLRAIISERHARHEPFPLHVLEQDLLTTNLTLIGATAVIVSLVPDSLARVRPLLAKWLGDECLKSSGDAAVLPEIVCSNTSSNDLNVLFSDAKRSASTVKNAKQSSRRGSSSNVGSKSVASGGRPVSDTLSRSAPDVNRRRSPTPSARDDEGASRRGGWRSLPARLAGWFSRSSVAASKPRSSNGRQRRLVSVMFSIPEWSPSQVVLVPDPAVKSADSSQNTDWTSIEGPGIWLFLYDYDSIP